MRLRLISVLILLFSLNTATAQDFINTQLLSLSLDMSNKPLFFLGNKGVQEFQVSRQAIAPPVNYKGPQVLRLFATEEQAVLSADPEEPVKPLLTIHLPANQDRILVLISKKVQDKKTLLYGYAVGISTQQMSEGDYRLFNLSKRQLLVKIDQQVVSLPSGKNQLLKDTKWRNEICDIDVALAVINGKEREIIYQLIWGNRPQQRTFIFCFEQNDRYRPIQMRRFYDMPSVTAVAKNKNP